MRYLHSTFTNILSPKCWLIQQSIQGLAYKEIQFFFNSNVDFTFCLYDVHAKSLKYWS